MPELLLSCQGLTKAFGDRVVVRDLTMKVRKGLIYGFLGPNGSGKTTTIRMLCGLLEPSGGTARVAGIDVAESPEQIKRRIGYMSQRIGLYDIVSKLDQDDRFTVFLARHRFI